MSLAALVTVVMLAGPAFGRQIPPGESGAVPPQQQPASPKTDEKSGDGKDAKNGTDSTKSSGDDGQKQEEAKKNDRIFGVMPNYSTVNANGNIAPISTGEKFKLVAEGSFDPYEFGIVGLVAAKGQADDDDAQWGQGWKGYGKRYAAAFADQVIGNFMTGAVVPSLIHQDPRYFRKGSGGFRRRTEYALSRIVVTQSDSGQREFNYSEFVGNGIAAGIGNAYHTADERTFSGTMGNFGTQIAVDALGNFLKEFWPDVRKKLSRHKPPS